MFGPSDAGWLSADLVCGCLNTLNVLEGDEWSSAGGRPAAEGKGWAGPLYFLSFLPQAGFSLVSSAGKLQRNSEVFLKPEQMEHFVKIQEHIFRDLFLDVLNVYSITLFF